MPGQTDEHDEHGKGDEQPKDQEDKEEDGDKQSGDDNKGPRERKGGDKAGQRKPLWPWLLAGAVVLGFIVVVLVIIFAPATSVWTDDAYVTAHYATIAPRISGQVASVDVDDNQSVRSGQVLASLDDRDFKTTLANNEAMLARDLAQADDLAAQIARLPSEIAQSQAELASQTAQLTFSEQNDKRYRNLASTGAGTFQERQQTDMALGQAQAGVARASASLESTRRQLPILQAQYAGALQTVKSDQAQVEQARLNLSYTRIVAPLDGMIGERSVQVGNYVGPGAALMSLVPLGRVYIVANYREEALRHMLPGQHARIHVDAYDLMLDGVVDSVPPASGASFAPIQPNNATGNFTKIVQRLPVKIVVSPGQNEALLLRMGLSVETTVETGAADVKQDQQNNPQRVTSR